MSAADEEPGLPASGRWAAALRHPKNVLRMVTAPFRERGFVETLRSIRATLRASRLERADAFDEAHGVETGKTLAASDFGAAGADVPALWRYWPTLRESFTRVMESVDVRHEDFVFVDLGSGKGRVLLMASEYPFKRIVGVELSPALDRVAQRNVRAYRSERQRCHTFELRCMNAAELVPPPENLVVYLFQPFPRETLAAVLENLRRSFEAAPREIVVAYLNPIFHELVLGAGFLELAAWGQAREPGEFDHAIYRGTREGRAA